MFTGRRDHGIWIGPIIGLSVLAVVVGCLVLYRVQAEETRRQFDDMLGQRADDVRDVVLNGNGGIDTNAFHYAGDINSLGMDVYLFYPDGRPLFAPDKRRVDGLPALAPLRSAEGGDEDVRSLALDVTNTRVLTRPVRTGVSETDPVAMIIQVGRSETPLAASLTRLARLIAAIGACIVLGVVLGGLLLLRQLAIPVRRSLAQQQEFIANAAHELRTPLSVIQATAELALMRPRGAEEYVQSMEQIARTVTRTSVMVDDLLTLAQMDATNKRPALTPTDLGGIAAAAAAEAMARYPENPITLTGDGAATIAGDTPLLQRMIANLIDNACRYNPPGTPVEIRLERQRRWIVLRVADAGEGIPSDDVPRLFDRFYRGRSGRQSGKRGVGLGLGLVRQIAAVHGGYVGIASRVGAGTTVTLFFPVTAPPTGGVAAEAPHRAT